MTDLQAKAITLKLWRLMPVYSREEVERAFARAAAADRMISIQRTNCLMLPPMSMPMVTRGQYKKAAEAFAKAARSRRTM